MKTISAILLVVLSGCAVLPSVQEQNQDEFIQPPHRHYEVTPTDSLPSYWRPKAEYNYKNV